MSMFFNLLFTYLGLVEFGVPCTADASFPERLSNHFQYLLCTYSDAVPSLNPSENRISQHTRLQIKGRRIQHVHSAAWNLVQCLSRYVSTIIYRCSALLLLYKWQHHSRNLWIIAEAAVNPVNHLETGSQGEQSWWRRSFGFEDNLLFLDHLAV
jgi:hypothetical protein